MKFCSNLTVGFVAGVFLYLFFIYSEEGLGTVLTKFQHFLLAESLLRDNQGEYQCLPGLFPWRGTYLVKDVIGQKQPPMYIINQNFYGIVQFHYIKSKQAHLVRINKNRPCKKH